MVLKTKEVDMEEIELGEDCMPKMVELNEGEEVSSSSINIQLQKCGYGGLGAFLERSIKEEKQKKKKIKEERGGVPLAEDATLVTLV